MQLAVLKALHALHSNAHAVAAAGRVEAESQAQTAL